MVDKIRVVMVGRYPFREGAPTGGVQSVAEVLSDSLARTGLVEMHCVTLMPEIAKPEFRQTAAGVNVHILPAGKRFGPTTGFFLDRLKLRAKAVKIKPDLVHVQAAAGPYARALLERGWPSLLSIHGLFFRDMEFEPSVRKFSTLLAAKYERDALRRARHVAILNNYTLSSLQEFLVRAEIRYIDNPIDDSFFGVENREEEGRVLVPALIWRLKGHRFLLEAVADLIAEGRQLTVCCAGGVTDYGYYAELQQLVADKGLSDYVRFEGNVSRQQMLDQYARCSIVVLPSLVENAPLVVSEGMAAGKPVVATAVGGIPEMIDDGRTGFVVPKENSDALAEAIRKLLDSKELRSQIGTEAKKAAEARYKPEVAARKTLDYYYSILSKT